MPRSATPKQPPTCCRPIPDGSRPEPSSRVSLIPASAGRDRPLFLRPNGRWYVGPGNGLFELVQRRAGATRSWDIEWKPERLSASFHGRDLFAPVAAMLARGDPPPGSGAEPAETPHAGSARS